MNLIEQVQNKTLITKYAMKYVNAAPGRIESDLEEMQAKYKMTNDDYIKMLVGMQILAVRGIKTKDSSDSIAKQKEFAKIEEKVA